MDDELSAINEIIIGILGNEHPIAIQIMNGDQVMFYDVLAAVLEELDKRVSEIEARRLH
jgi:hypothetical protein